LGCSIFGAYLNENSKYVLLVCPYPLIFLISHFYYFMV
jgi:hypothetical protein